MGFGDKCSKVRGACRGEPAVIIVDDARGTRGPRQMTSTPRRRSMSRAFPSVRHSLQPTTECCRDGVCSDQELCRFRIYAAPRRKKRLSVVVDEAMKRVAKETSRIVVPIRPQ